MFTVVNTKYIINFDDFVNFNQIDNATVPILCRLV